MLPWPDGDVGGEVAAVSPDEEEEHTDDEGEVPHESWHLYGALRSGYLCRYRK